MHRQRRRDDNNEDTHRWLVSYADFITLLFAFFVVMYSVSQVNEGKYKVLSDVMVQVFKDKPHQPQNNPSINTDINHVDSGGTPPDPGVLQGSEKQSENVVETAGQQEISESQSAATLAGATQEQISLPQNSPATAQEKREFAKLYQNLTDSLQSLIKAGVVDVRGNEDWIEVDMRSGLLFDSGSDVPGSAAIPIVRELAEQLKSNTHLMRVRGYTDDRTIETDRFPSNWELASSRAVAVVRMLQQFGIKPQRLAVEGFGEYQPVVSNDSDQNRARNRRVVLAISRFHELAEIVPPAGNGAVSSQPAVGAEPSALAADVAKQDAAKAPSAGNDKKAEPFEVVRMPNGELIIRGRNEAAQDSNGTKEKNTPQP